MKNSVFASLFVEAVNNAGEANGMANTISEMLNHISQNEALRKSRNTDKRTKKHDRGQSSSITSDTNTPLNLQKSNKIKIKDDNSSSVFSRELKQKEYRKLVSARPYYFLSLDSLIEKKSEASNTFERARLKLIGQRNISKLRQAENKYQRVLEEAEREIQLKIKERLQQGKTIPRRLLVNDGFVLSEEGVKRDERRRQLIVEEARAATAHREAITKVTTSKLAPQSAVNQEELQQSFRPVTPKNLPQRQVSETSESFDRAMYFELLKSMSRDEAWRMVKSKKGNAGLQEVSFQEGECCYIHSLCYAMQLNAGIAPSDALNVATSIEKAEGYLRNNIAGLTANRIKSLKNTSILTDKIITKKKVQAIKFTTLHHFNIIDSVRYNHRITTRSAGVQANFKLRVLHNFYHCCAVTGQTVGALLQACHIEEYALAGNMSTNNGILLSADCHRLFDENLLGIDPEKLTVHFKVPCIYSSMFEGKRIFPHRLALDKNKLIKKWEKFQSK